VLARIDIVPVAREIFRAFCCAQYCSVRRIEIVKRAALLCACSMPDKAAFFTEHAASAAQVD
jgi:hypothetical protein